MIIEHLEALKEISSELTIRGLYEEEAIVRRTSSASIDTEEKPQRLKIIIDRYLLQDPSRMITISTVDETSTSIDLQSHTTIDAYRCTSIDSHSGQITLKMLKWINLSTIHTCLDCLKEPKLTSNTKPDIIACLGAWYTWDRILQTSLEGLIHKDSNKRIRTGLRGGNLQGSLHKEFLDIGQKEVNMAWWHPPLSLDSWKPV
ncbi:hypothetical protein F2Q68_00022123 [Brassica cretica]|uniref:Uncharacterized protein n=1 Tax=Brassica cretica TaxID=69181 RepID=A0A8S9FZP2_BRACR|nr:hypothetical protein F2Q68_00022123 [Brassica cretica]